ncbi:MAG TPA: DUF4276 family protein [Actinomycetota bacterium]|nr:DUF4276 family protein [Actinomycetota bacterium]
MKIGIVVDGNTEYLGLPAVLEQLKELCDAVLMTQPLKANIQPYSNPAVIARACKSRLVQLEAKGADCVVVLLDRETRPECPGELATAIRQQLAILAPVCVGEVVVKDRKFENWVIADLAALRSQPARFRIGNQVARTLSGQVDGLDAESILEQATLRRPYSKVQDGVQTLRRADHLQMAAHSRSFRRFLRVLQHAQYETQSRVPVAPAGPRRR